MTALQQNLHLNLASVIPDYKNKRYLLSVSGGVDSICLLHLFAELFPSDHLRVIHCNFHLRPEQNTLEVSLIKSLCENYGIVCHVLSLKKESAANTQAWARSERLRHSFRLLKEEGADYLVLAHHQGDHFETLFGRWMQRQHLMPLRGFSLKRGRVLRPLLAEKKESLKALAAANDWSFIEDQSNRKDSYRRNRIRHHILEPLKRFPAKALDNLLLLAGDQQKLGRWHWKLLSEAGYLSAGRGWVFFHPKFFSLEAWEQTSILHQSLEYLRVYKRISRAELRDWLKKMQSRKALELKELSASRHLIFDRAYLWSSPLAVREPTWKPVGAINTKKEALESARLRPGKLPKKGQWLSTREQGERIIDFYQRPGGPLSLKAWFKKWQLPALWLEQSFLWLNDEQEVLGLLLPDYKLRRPLIKAKKKPIYRFVPEAKLFVDEAALVKGEYKTVIFS